MTRKKGKTATVGMKIAVRRAVKEAWYSDKNMDREHIERKYNIKL